MDILVGFFRLFSCFVGSRFFKRNLWTAKTKLLFPVLLVFSVQSIIYEIVIPSKEIYFRLQISENPPRWHRSIRGIDPAFSGKQLRYSWGFWFHTDGERTYVAAWVYQRRKSCQENHVGFTMNEAFWVTMKCPACGNEDLQEHHRFCSNCGSTLSQGIKSSGETLTVSKNSSQQTTSVGDKSSDTAG